MPESERQAAAGRQLAVGILVAVVAGVAAVAGWALSAYLEQGRDDRMVIIDRMNNNDHILRERSRELEKEVSALKVHIEYLKSRCDEDGP